MDGNGWLVQTDKEDRWCKAFYNDNYNNNTISIAPQGRKQIQKHFVTKQYNSVLGKGQWCSMSGKETMRLVESNGSLLPGT